MNGGQPVPKLRTIPCLIAITTTPVWVHAGEADVVNATVHCKARVCTISATVSHADVGWDHYANHWRVVGPDGAELARRVLHHPHEHEQPFTRSLGKVEIPREIDHVFIEAHDSVHNYGGERFRLDIP